MPFCRSQTEKNSNQTGRIWGSLVVADETSEFNQVCSRKFASIALFGAVFARIRRLINVLTSRIAVNSNEGQNLRVWSHFHYHLMNALGNQEIKTRQSVRNKTIEITFLQCETEALQETESVTTVFLARQDQTR